MSAETPTRLRFRLQYKLSEIYPFFAFGGVAGLRTAVKRGQIEHVMHSSTHMIPLYVVFDRAGIHGDDRIKALGIGMETGYLDLVSHDRHHSEEPPPAPANPCRCCMQDTSSHPGVTLEP